MTLSASEKAHLWERTPLIDLQVLTVYLALPVYLLVADNLATRLYAGHVALVTRPVLKQEQPRGARLAYLVEHLPECLAAREEQQEHCNVGFCRLFHII